MRKLPLELIPEDPQRCRDAIASFLDGGYVWLRDPVMSIGLRRTGPGGVLCTLFVPDPPSERSQDAARRLFESGKGRLSALRATVPELDAALQPLRVRFALHYDYGMGSVRLCSEHGDRYEWA